MDALQEFEQHRPFLFGLAYRMLGTVADAQDVVQEAWIRYAGEQASIRSTKAFLATVVTRLCLDELRSAHSRKETYIGPWLPEPAVLPAASDSLSYTFLVLMQRLSAQERAVFLLREVFEYEYAEIAAMIELTEANCRQLFKRAREHVGSRRARFAVPPGEQKRLLESFLDAIGTGNLDQLTSLLAADATLYTDGGGKVRSALNPIHSAAFVGRFFLGVADKQPPGATIRIGEINGEPAILGVVDGRVYFALTALWKDGRMQELYAVSNPDKLQLTGHTR